MSHDFILAAVQSVLVRVYLCLHPLHGPCLDRLSVLVVQVTTAPAQALDADPGNVSPSTRPCSGFKCPVLHREACIYARRMHKCRMAHQAHYVTHTLQHMHIMLSMSVCKVWLCMYFPVLYNQ